MVRNYKYKALKYQLEDARERVKATDALNARLMAVDFALRGEADKLKEKLTATETKLDKCLEILRNLDRERLKTVAKVKDISRSYGALTRMIADMDSDCTKRYFCERCAKSDGVCCCSDTCTFEVRT